MGSDMRDLETLGDRLAESPLQEIGGKWYFREVDVAGETADSFEFFKSHPENKIAL